MLLSHRLSRHVITDEKRRRDMEDLHTSYSLGVSTVIEHTLRSGRLALGIISRVKHSCVPFANVPHQYEQ